MGKVYLDNAATSQSPKQVMEASTHYYSHINANIHRAAHKLAREATAAHEGARETIANHLNCKHSHELIFTSGTTDSINLVSNTLALSGKISAGDKIIISTLEHHANIVPWQMLCERTGAILKVIPMNQEGELITLPTGMRHRLVGLDSWGVVTEIWQHTDATHPSDEADIVRLQDDFGR